MALQLDTDRLRDRTLQLLAEVGLNVESDELVEIGEVMTGKPGSS